MNVLLTVDEASYSGAQMGLGAGHPISWNHLYDGGRSWYTSLGHDTNTLSNPIFADHLHGGIRWAALGNPRPAPALRWPSVVALACLLAAVGRTQIERSR